MSTIYLYTGMYSRKLVEQYPMTTFVFGDNTKRVGMGGQACIRPCENTLGVATKVNPGGAEADFFEEGNALHMRHVARDLLELEQHMADSKTACLVLPCLNLPGLPSSLGCGLAQLPHRAPTLYAMINSWQRRMRDTYYTSIIRQDLA